MEKTATMNPRVNSVSTQQAEDIFDQLGIPMATAIDICLQQTSLAGGIPFPSTVANAPAVINADTMSVQQLRAELLAIKICLRVTRRMRRVPLLALEKAINEVVQCENYRWGVGGYDGDLRLFYHRTPNARLREG